MGASFVVDAGVIGEELVEDRRNPSLGVVR